MQQLYAVGSISSCPNAGQANTPAPRRALQLPSIQASTSGLTAEHLHAVLPHTLYATTNRPTEAERPLPVRLALLKTPTGRLLTHAAPDGESYLAHTLVNVPDTADAQLAIQTWGSPQWQRTPPDSATDLPDLPYLPVADVLDDAAVQRWLETPTNRELLEFTLTALLGVPTDTPVYLAAPAVDVATVIYAITRALPADLLADFTFSTFEADPTACRAKLIGHDPGGPEHDLPDICYRSGSAFHAYTGKRSDLRVEVPYAAFAVKALAVGELAPLDDLRGTWQRLGLKDAQQLDLVYRMARGTGTLTKAEAADALQHPPLAAWISARTDALNQFLDWALDDRAFAHQSFVRAVQSLRQKPDVLAKLAATVRDAGVKAIQDGDKARTANALEVVLPMASPAKANAVWGELLTLVPDPARLPWEMRWYLLPRFVRFKQQQNPTGGADPTFAQWLDMPADRLGEFLALDLPKAYQLAACRTCLKREGEPTALLTTTLAKHPALVLTLLQPTEGEFEAIRLYESLLADAPGEPWFEAVIGRAPDYPLSLLNTFFESTLATNKLDADRLVRTQGERLIDLFAGQSGLDRLGQQFLATPPVDVLNNHSVLSFLNKLREQDGLSDTLRERIDAVKVVRAYLDAPHFTAEAVAPVAAAFTLSPSALPADAKERVFEAVATELTKRFPTDRLQADLEAVLTQFGSILAAGPADLYENLLRTLRNRNPEFGRDANAVPTFLALALGATESPELAGQLDGLDGHAFAVASDAAKRGGRRLLDVIDARAKSWSKEAQTKWGFLLAAVRPRSRWQRDLVCAAIGALVATIGWLVWTFAG